VTDSITPRKPSARPFCWLACGWQLAHRRPDLFIGMTTLYLLLAVLLTRIPFVGPLLLVLVTPALAAGAWLAARSIAHGNGQPAIASELPAGRRTFAQTFGTYVLQPLRSLLQALTDERRVLATSILCMVCLGLVMALKITEYIFIGGSMISALQSPEVMSWLRPVTLIGMALVAVLAVLIGMALFFVVPLATFDRIDALTAVGRGFVASARNIVSVLVFFSPFLVAYATLIAAFAVNAFLGYFTTFTLGPIVLANYIGGVYCCYRDVFESDPVVTPDHS